MNNKFRVYRLFLRFLDNQALGFLFGFAFSSIFFSTELAVTFESLDKAGFGVCVLPDQGEANK